MPRHRGDASLHSPWFAAHHEMRTQAALTSIRQCVRRVPPVDVAPMHRAIYRRWGDACATAVVRSEVDWLAVREHARTAPGGGARDEETLDQFFELCHENLDELIRGDVSLQALLFDNPRLDVTRILYSDNPLSRDINDHVAQRIVDALSRRQDDGRIPTILEIGAGTGALTDRILDLCRDQPLHYIYTDVSTWFLHRAELRYAGRSGMTYQLIDINAEDLRFPRADVIVCGNVLHNCLHIDRCLDRCRASMRSDGRFIIVETGTEHLPLLMSVRFMMSREDGAEFSDERSRTGRIFLSQDQWRNLAGHAGFTVTDTYPGTQHPLAFFDQFSIECSVVPLDSDNVASSTAAEEGAP